jgi:hypothetical protein
LAEELERARDRIEALEMQLVQSKEQVAMLANELFLIERDEIDNYRHILE